MTFRQSFATSPCTADTLSVFLEQADQLERRVDFQKGLDAYAEMADERLPLSSFVKGARVYLQHRFGVDDLSVIEGVRFRHCVEEALEAFDREYRKGEEGGYINLYQESAYRWLSSAYDVSSDFLNRELFQPGGVSDAFKEWLRKERCERHLI